MQANGSGTVQGGVTDICLSFFALQPLTALTLLAELRLAACAPTAIHSSSLSGSRQLTRLEVSGGFGFVFVIEPGTLATLTQLQHLGLALEGIDSSVGPADGAATGVGQLLTQMQHLQQLTHIKLQLPKESTPPAAAFSALTASSKLQFLSIARLGMPAGVWQHVFPAGWQLPHLQHLDIAHVTDDAGYPVSAPEGSRLVSCCPGLQFLDMRSLQYSAEGLAPLQVSLGECVGQQVQLPLPSSIHVIAWIMTIRLKGVQPTGETQRGYSTSGCTNIFHFFSFCRG